MGGVDAGARAVSVACRLFLGFHARIQENELPNLEAEADMIVQNGDESIDYDSDYNCVGAPNHRSSILQIQMRRPEGT